MTRQVQELCEERGSMREGSEQYPVAQRSANWPHWPSIRQAHFKMLLQLRIPNLLLFF